MFLIIKLSQGDHTTTYYSRRILPGLGPKHIHEWEAQMSLMQSMFLWLTRSGPLLQHRRGYLNLRRNTVRFKVLKT